MKCMVYLFFMLVTMILEFAHVHKWHLLLLSIINNVADVFDQP